MASAEDLRQRFAAASSELDEALAPAQTRAPTQALAAVRAAGEAMADALSIAEAVLEARDEHIEAQHAVLARIGVPVLQVGVHTLLVPLVGDFDAARAAQLAEILLTAAVTRRVRTAVIDLTGAVISDTSTAGELANVFQALRLVGVRGIVSGVGPELAPLLAEVHGMFADVRWYGDLASALAEDTRQDRQRP